LIFFLAGDVASARWDRGAVGLTREAGSAGDPSLRLKNGSVQDDAE